MNKIYKAEEIFEDIPNDKENVLMKIPPEVCEAAGFEEGDTLKIEIGDQGTLIINKVESKENNE